MKNQKRTLLAGIACLCLLASMLFPSISVLAMDDLSNYDKTTYVAPTRLWGADSVGDVAGMGTRWIYEAAQDKNGNYVTMNRVQDTNTPKDAPVFMDVEGNAQLESLWSNGSLYLSVGYHAGSRDIAQTFVAPADGYITTDAVNVERKYGMEEYGYEANAELAIFLNDKKIWPVDDTWAEIGNATTPHNKLTVPALDQIAVKAGDKLRFVVNMGKNFNYDDRIQWPVAVNMYAEKAGNNEGGDGNEGNGDVQDEVDLSSCVKNTYVAPTRLWGADSVGDVAGMGTRWIYEAAQDKNGNYVTMNRVQDTNTPKDAPVFMDVEGNAQLESLWGNGFLYLSVGYHAGSRDIAQTFVAPADGYITTDAVNVERKYGMEEYGYEASAELAIFLNDKKIWPADNTWAEIGNATTPHNKLTVPALDQIAVKAGDKLRFVVNMGKNFNYDDRIQWPVAVNMYTEKAGDNEGGDDNEGNNDNEGTGDNEGNGDVQGAVDLSSYVKNTFIAPTRLWGADSVGDVAGMGTRWIYEFAQDKAGNYTVMKRIQDTDMPKDAPVFMDVEGNAQLESLWGNGSLYLSVGYYAGSRDIAQTFVVPVDGYITTDAVNVERKYGMEEYGYEANAELAIFLNDKKIWPADDTWAEIGNATAPHNKLTVPALDQIAVKAGDKLRFVVSAGKNFNYDDRIQWPVAVNMYTEEKLPGSTITTDKADVPDTGDSDINSIAAIVFVLAAIFLAFSVHDTVKANK